MADIALTPALLILLFVLVVLGAFAARRRVLFRIGARNFVRHRSTSALVVAGLLVGSAILSAAAVLGDSVAFAIVRGAYERYDRVDVEVRGENGGVFNASVSDALLASASVTERSDAAAPLLTTYGAVDNQDSGQAEPFMAVQGFDPSLDRGLGPFDPRGRTGDLWGDELNATLIYLNVRAADVLDADEGDRLNILLLNPSAPRPAVAWARVAAIVEDSGKGGYGSSATVFFRLDVLQAHLALPDAISVVRFSAPGGVEEGARSSGALAESARSVVAGLGSAGAGLAVREVKADALDQAQQASEGIRIFLTIMGSFSIIAGVVLIINIFTMLAEERKVELGMGRAMGMRRSTLVQLFVFEGLTYAVAAAGAGTLVGIGIGAVIISSINSIFGTLGASLPIVVAAGSMIDAFAVGVLLTLATICFAAYRLSRFNIITAVRDLPEHVTERASRRLAYTGAALAVFLLLLATASRENAMIMALLLAVSVIAFSVPLSRWLPSRAAYSGGALVAMALVLWNLGSQSPTGGGLETFAAGFIGAGVVIVFASVLIVIANSDYVSSGLARLMAASRTLRPAAKVSAAYPLYRRFRTGSTVTMFGLVLFTIVVLSIFTGVFSSDIDEQLRAQSGGYDILGTSIAPVTLTNASAPPLGARVERFVQFGSLKAPVLARGRLLSQGGGGFGPVGGDTGSGAVTVLGADLMFTSGDTPSLSEIAPGYDQASAWAAVEDGTGTVLTSSVLGGGGFGPPGGAGGAVGVGEPVQINGTAGPLNLTAVGVTQSFFIQGIIVSRSALLSAFPGDPRAVNSTFFLFKSRDTADLHDLTHDLERELRPIGMNAVNLRESVELIQAAFNTIFLLFQSFLGLGLVVGIAGLAIVTARNVVERKREIGVLRALGFRRSLVLKSQLIEVLLVVSLGVVIGLVVGIAFAAQLFSSSEIAGVELTIPWNRLGLIFLITYAAVLLASVIPVLRAARIRPAEALRVME
ncbi:MAG TPA: FtsX-like permease family protein [Thermoplasmata archaeon]|nr:FtsX-like permease family protein [Thermoplasmata archaeon]